MTNFSSNMNISKRVSSLRSHFSLSAFLEAKIAKRQDCSLKSFTERPDFGWRLFFYSYQVLKSVRHLIGSYSIITDKLAYFYYDVLLAGLMRDQIYDSVNAMLASPVSLLEMAVDHVIEDKTEEYFLRFIYELVVVNGQRFFTLNPELCPKSRRDPRELVKSVQNVLKVKSAKFHKRRLEHLGVVSCRTRIKIILLAILIEWIYFLTIVGIGITLIAYLLYYFTKHYFYHNSTEGCMLAFTELLLVGYASFNALKILIFFNLIVITNSVANSIHLRYLNQSLKKTSKNGNLDEHYLVTFLGLFYREHSRIAHFARRFNGKIIHQLTAITVFLNTLINVYFYRRFFAEEAALYFTLTVVQLLLVKSFLSPLMYLYKHLDVSASYIYIIQLRITDPKLVEKKVKLMNYFQFLQAEKADNCSNLNIAKTNSLLQMILYYCAYLLLAVKFSYKVMEKFYKSNS